MSNAGQAGSAIIGGIIGFFVSGFNPMGFIYGAQIGLLAGTYIFPTQLPGQFGPRMEDLATTSAQLGGPVPIVWGTIAVPGTVIFLSCVEERTTTEEVGGKSGGGSEQTITTYTYFQTIAVGLCEGPITDVLRIWENGELRYDMRPQQDDESTAEYAERIEMSSIYGAGFFIYLGDESQEADPTLEAIMGVGEVPAFRGLAYVVYPDRQLQDNQARRHPQFRFEVHRTPGEQEILPPTQIDGPLDNYQNPFVLPYWPSQIYYTIDLTSTSGIRIFDVLTNEETRQVLFDDIGIDDTLGFQSATIGPDGFLYMCFFVSLNTLSWYRIDPTSMEVDDSIEFGGAANVPERSLVIRHRTFTLDGELFQTNDFIFSQGLFGAFTVRRANPPGFALGVVDYPEADGVICHGHTTFTPVAGMTSYAYGLTWSIAASGTGDDIAVWRLKIEQVLGLTFIPFSIPTIEQIATIPLSAIDPAATRLTSLSGLHFDETDRCLIFGVSCSGPASGSGAEVYTGYVKYDPATDEIVWRTEEMFIEINDDMSHESRLRGGTLGIPQPNRQIALIDTRTGSHTLIDVDIPNNMFGQSVYDSAHGTVITFVIGAGPYVIFLDRRVPGQVSVAHIISDVCERAGLTAEEIDVSDLEDRNVQGYASTRTSPARGIIEPLRQVAFFDACESDGILKYPARGAPIALTLSEDDLGAHYAEEERPPLVTTNKMQDVELPRRIRLQYIAESRDYDSGDAPSPSRITSGAVNEVDIQAPVSISDNHARQAAEVLWADAWGSRWTYQTALDVSFLALDATDVIGIPVDGRVYRARIVSIEDAAGFLRKLTLMRDDDGTYTSTAQADPPQRPRVRITSYSPTALLLLDLPPLADSHNDAGIYAVAYPMQPARTWGGAVIHRSIDGGTTYSQIGSIVSPGTVGELVEPLPSGISTTWDLENTLEVEVISGGGLESRTEEAVLGGANAAAVGIDGRWEIIQYLNATQVSDTRWQLTGLLRGRRATEHNIGTSEAGDLFVVLSTGTLVRLPLQLSEVGLSRTYRAVTLGTSTSGGIPQDFIGRGEALRPFSPVHIHGTRSGGDLIIEWTRRGRFGQELRSGTDIPLSEEEEAYEVDILVPGASPQTAVRTLETSTTSVTYTAAEQSADGFDSDDPIMVRVYQMSAAVGRGTPGEATL